MATDIPVGDDPLWDHTEFMVLVLQLDDVFREPTLNFSSQKVLPGEGFALVSPIIVSTRFSVLPGFAPAGEALLFRQKDPKPLTPRLASLERRDASLRRADQLAPLKQGPPADESASPIGQTTGVESMEDKHCRDSHEKARSSIFCMIRNPLAFVERDQKQKKNF